MDDQRVKISGLDIPFWDLVVLMIKLAFASIPAMIVISYGGYLAQKYIFKHPLCRL